MAGLGLDRLTVANLTAFYNMMGINVPKKPVKEDMVKKVGEYLVWAFSQDDDDKPPGQQSDNDSDYEKANIQDIDSDMTRFNHEGKAYECNTSDLMDISVEAGRGDNGPDGHKDDPDDKGDKPDKYDDDKQQQTMGNV